MSFFDHGESQIRLRDETLNSRGLKPDEMPEYTLRFGNPTMPNWNCMHCWRSGTLSPYESKDKQMAGIISHVKAKYVVRPSPSVCSYSARLTPSFLCSHRHSIEEPAEEDYYFNWSDGVPQFVHLDGNHDGV